ncbi:MAG: DUF3833 domain-containing protein [Gammaproteobacteria bacterium]|nr:DUF3833 domain-containing protein [Gammaproteobacteria bacterium]
MLSFSRLLTLILSVLLISSCATSLDEYADSQPEFKLEEFFSGKLTAWGTFEDYSGKVTRRFKVEMTGTWNGNKGVLDEDFYYDDGEEQKRIWRLTKEAPGVYSGEADDIVGVAKGEVKGFALNWSYTMSLPVDDDIYEVHFDDWMYLLDDKSVINKATVSKFGFEVGQVTLFIQKQ